MVNCDLIDSVVGIENYTKEELYKIAFYESVSNHFNWSWMRDKLEHFEQYGIDDFVFVHFDIKDFKMINELFNHAVADELLRKICRKMSELDWAYFTCRCDNDNFAMMIKRMSEDEIREKLTAFFEDLSVLDEDSSYPVYFRCGVAAINNVKDYNVIVTDMAKLAQGLGKKANITEIHFYTDAMKEEQIMGKLLKNEFAKSLDNGEFIVYFQPKVNPKTGEIVGAEALIRWNYHNSGEIWSPGLFVPYFEKENIIETLDLYVLKKVCENLEEWKKKGYKLVPISINMSKTQVYSPMAVKRIMDVVNKFDIDRSYIDFELTETLAYEDKNYLIGIMKELRKLGFQLSMDDFGTGFSSLNLLSTMPLTTIKIDKSFIDEIGGKDGERICFVIKDIINMAKHLDLVSIAEGVETEMQRNLIREWGCDYIQGYFYSKPVPSEVFSNMIKEQ